MINFSLELSAHVSSHFKNIPWIKWIFSLYSWNIVGESIPNIKVYLQKCRLKFIHEKLEETKKASLTLEIKFRANFTISIRKSLRVFFPTRQQINLLSLISPRSIFFNQTFLSYLPLAWLDSRSKSLRIKLDKTRSVPCRATLAVVGSLLHEKENISRDWKGSLQKERRLSISPSVATKSI